MTRAERRWWWLALAIVAAAVGALLARRSVDFPVYYATAMAWRRHGGPIYGPHSGLGWPMYYRYPPLFVVLFAPLTWLPLAWAAGLWAAGKVIVLGLLVRALARPLRRDQPGSPLPKRPVTRPQRWIAALVPILLASTYLLVEFRYGNVQFYIFALAAAAFLLARRTAAGAAALLALAAAIKVWPLFLIPYWLTRRRYRAAALAVLFAAVLTLAPALVWGWRGNLRLLAQWEHQERATALQAGSIWYPSQSLRGVLTRYLTRVPPAVTGGRYPAVNLAAWPEAVVSRLWLVLDLLGYALLLIFAWRARAPSWGVDGVAFCALALLIPFAHIEDLVVVLWPAMVAGWYLARRHRKDNGAASLLWAAVIWAAVIPLVPGHAAQRWLQVAGADFLVVALLAAGLIVVCQAAKSIGAGPTGPLEDDYRAAG